MTLPPPAPPHTPDSSHPPQTGPSQAKGWATWSPAKKWGIAGGGGLSFLLLVAVVLTEPKATPDILAATETTTTAVPVVAAPALICLDLDAATDLISDLDIDIIDTVDDSGEGRSQLWLSNWSVVGQEPSEGQPADDGIQLRVLKHKEATVCQEQTNESTIPASTVVLTPSEVVRAAALEAIGESNRGVERFTEFEYHPDSEGFVVMWTLNQNFNSEMTLDRARTEVTRMLRVLQDSGIAYESVVFEGTLPLVDNFGNVEETRVVLAWYESSTVDKINFENFLLIDVFDPPLTSDVFIHPALTD